MNQYHYEGPVFEFDRLVADKWSGSTYAATESKARSNLAYQYKKTAKRMPNVKITLPGKLTIVR